jgi:hypothetical protein
MEHAPPPSGSPEGQFSLSLQTLLALRVVKDEGRPALVDVITRP